MYLCVLFKETLEQFLVESAVVKPIHLKELLRCHITELQAHKNTWCFSGFAEDVGSILSSQGCMYDQA